MEQRNTERDARRKVAPQSPLLPTKTATKTATTNASASTTTTCAENIATVPNNDFKQGILPPLASDTTWTATGNRIFQSLSHPTKDRPMDLFIVSLWRVRVSTVQVWRAASLVIEYFVSHRLDGSLSREDIGVSESYRWLSPCTSTAGIAA